MLQCERNAETKALQICLYFLVRRLTSNNAPCLQVMDPYKIPVGEFFGEFSFLKSINDNLSNFNNSFVEEHECPACPKVCFTLFK